MKKIIIIVSCLFTSAFSSYSQDLKLEKPPVFSPVKIKKAEVVSDNPERLNLSFEYNITNGKAYIIEGIAMDNNQQVIKDITADEQELAGGGGLADLSFRFKKISEKKYTKPTMESKYILVKFREKKAGGGLLDNPLFKDQKKKDNPLDDAFSIKYLYKYTKEWRVGCSGGMIIKVTLKPIGRANTVRG